MLQVGKQSGNTGQQNCVSKELTRCFALANLWRRWSNRGYTKALHSEAAAIWLVLPPSHSPSPTILGTAKAMLRYLWMLCSVALWTQMVEQRINCGSSPEVVGSIATELKRIFSLPSVIPWFPLLGLTPSRSFMGFKKHFNLHFRVNALFYH